MRITIVTIGSRGDVQPYVALGLGLQRAGHQVRLATWARTHDFVIERGLDHAAIYRLPRDIQLVEGAGSWLAAGRHSLEALGQFMEMAEESLVRSLADCVAAC